jgi:polysaccharide biosynthesis/export protein
VTTPPGYLIGPDDVLQIVFWRDKDLSAEVVVRPDGRISLPLLNELQAAGSTPEQLRAALVERATQYIAEPNITILVKEIRSRRVFITGAVEKPGPFPLTGPTTVLQLIALAGGLKEFADQKNIVIMRTVNGQQSSYPFDYHSVSRGAKLTQNLELKPGDTVVVR